MGLDSVELIMAIEEEFGVEIPDAAAEKMARPRDLMDWLHARRTAEGFFSEGVLARRRSWLAVKFDKIPDAAEQQRVRNLTREEVEEAVRRIIREQLGVKRFSDTDRLIEDLGMG